MRFLMGYTFRELLIMVLYQHSRILLIVFLICVVTTFLHIRLGFLLRLYTELLERTFEWAIKYSSIHEEEEVSEHERRPAKQRVRSRAPQRGLVHREAVEMLRLKLRNASSTRLNQMNDNGVPQSLTERTCLHLIVDDALDFFKAGFETICQDELNTAMEAEELPCWNMLSRSRHMYPAIQYRVKLIWIVGCAIRYLLFFPVRLALLMFGLLFLGGSTMAISLVPLKHPWRKPLATYCWLVAFRLMGKSTSMLVTYHDHANRPKCAGICVANHTTPFDLLLLNAEDIYAQTGQKHGAMLGYMQKALSRLAPQLWFERSNEKDRRNVLQAMKDHLTVPSNPPIALFPEGVCVNNTAIVQFRKGAFEASDTIYPIAVRYDNKFCDAFWWQDTWIPHLMHILTSWALVADVYFLPAVHKQPNQTAIDFANEVKAAISTAAGLSFLTWDGFLKMYTVKPEMKESEKKNYSEHLLRNYSLDDVTDATWITQRRATEE